MPSSNASKRLSVALAAFLAAACAQEAERDDTPPTPLDRTTRNLERPVMVGFDGPRFDACASFGEVYNLNPQGDNYLSVRAGPSSSAEEVDRIGPGTGVSMCQKTGGWLGIVYAPSDEPELQCGTGSPVGSVRAYDGPCRSGWVSDDYIRLIAG